MKKTICAVSVIAAVCLMLTVSCSKNEEPRKAESSAEIPEPPPEIPAPEPEPEPADTVPAEIPAEAAKAPVKVIPPAPAPAPAPAVAAADRNVVIEYISGPKQAYVGQGITLTCEASGAGAASEYVWRFKNGDNVVEKATREPRVTLALGKAGDYAITCDIVEAGKTLASQKFSIRVLDSQPPANSGGASE